MTSPGKRDDDSGAGGKEGRGEGVLVLESRQVGSQFFPEKNISFKTSPRKIKSNQIKA